MSRIIRGWCAKPANRTGAEMLGERCGILLEQDGPYPKGGMGTWRMVCPVHGTCYWVTFQ